MSRKLVCHTCDRRGLATTDETAQLQGWRIVPGLGEVCPACVSLEPTVEDDEVALVLDTQPLES